MAVVGTRGSLAVMAEALCDREPRHRLDQTADLPMKRVTGPAAHPIGGGRPLEQGGHYETSPDGDRDQHHPPGEPAQPVGHKRRGSGWRRRRRGSDDGTSHAGTTPFSGLLTHSSDALT
ncbi:hypothetical protein [Micromonospora sp. NBC_01638]|uniref:hypothetical protein n=1 Tax=Micromonospora sp. NBC_01638 TaxID=2975982 RepID=UPI0038684B9A|nr:hypothetical protein OG811_30770 [Micromonospora sp. NBC_01638]